MKKALIAYFSCSGVTARLAKTLAEAAGGDLYEIKPKVPYTSADLNWNDKNSRSSVEMKDKTSRPEIDGKVDNMNEYDTVFVGYPIWWGVAPTIVNTFLESYDLSGKTVIPFATSGGSGIGNPEKYLYPSCSAQTSWRPGKKFSAMTGVDTLKKWIVGLEL